MPVLFDEIPLENIGKIKMITTQGNPPFEIGAFAHVASNPILVFSIEFAAFERILLLSVPYCLIMNNNFISEYWNLFAAFKADNYGSAIVVHNYTFRVAFICRG